MEPIRIKELKVGDYFQLNNNESSPLWKRGEYIRENKRYSCTKYDDSNHEMPMKGEKVVYADRD